MEPYRRSYPVDFTHYKLYEAIGEGASATVHRALCIPFNEIVAIKVLDLEKCNDLDDIRREVQTMSLIDHPRVLRALCSFTTGYSLWVVMPYMDGGSCFHLMKSYYPEGFEERVIATILHGALMALDYLHTNGHIHRDVKAGNILLDSNGVVKLADFGISACVFDTCDGHRPRNTLRGTPSWMAPEVVRQEAPYCDFRVDIWSFGITALELAHGHAPYSNSPPSKIWLMILTNSPPGLTYERDKRFSKSFGKMIAACLVKDPKKRPAANELLKHCFFRKSKTDVLVRKINLKELSPLGERFQKLKEKEEALLQQKKDVFSRDKEKSSQVNVEDNASSSNHQSVDWNRGKQKVSCGDASTPVHNSSAAMTNASTSGLSYEGSTVGFFNPGFGNSSTQVAQIVSANSIMPPMQIIWEQNEIRTDEIIKLMNYVEQSTGNPIEPVDVVVSDVFQVSTTSAPNGMLQDQVIHLQQAIGSLGEELEKQILINTKLEKQLIVLGREE